MIVFSILSPSFGVSAPNGVLDISQNIQGAKAKQKVVSLHLRQNTGDRLLGGGGRDDRHRRHRAQNIPQLLCCRGTRPTWGKCGDRRQPFAHGWGGKEDGKRNEQKFENDCIEAVMKNAYAEFPQSLINQGVERNVARLEQQAKQYNLPVEVLLQYYQMGTLEDFKKSCEEQVRKEFLQELVFEEIIKLENLTASEEEIEAKYLELAGGDASKVKDVKKQYKENQIVFHIKTLKAVDLIKNSTVSK